MSLKEATGNKNTNWQLDGKSKRDEVTAELDRPKSFYVEKLTDS